MKRIILAILLTGMLSGQAYAMDRPMFLDFSLTREQKAIKKVLKQQTRYAKQMNLEKFISTFDINYVNSDGFDLNTYSNLVNDVWKSYKNIKYELDIQSISTKGNQATVNVIEKSVAKLPVNEVFEGKLDSIAECTYYLKKVDGRWRVFSDKITKETTSMLYGEALNLDIKLSAPDEINANEEYCATLEFIPPDETMAIASIAADIIKYPQTPTKEVFRPLPDDCILERLFTSNDENANEYIVASIGLTKAAVEDLSLKLSLTGFGYKIKRVNVRPVNNRNDEQI